MIPKYTRIDSPASLAFALLSVFALQLLGAETKRPNIILIYTDDQGYGDVSALNPESKFQTPNLDRLVEEGMTFTDGHSSDTVCTPSRYGLLTGRYSWRTKLKRGVVGADLPCLIQNGRMTLASLLRDHGYQTAMIGKWHLGMQFVGTAGKGRDWSKPFTDGPIEKGFDHFFGIPASMNYGVLTYLDQDRITTPPTLWTKKKPGLVKYDKVSYRIAPPYDKDKGRNNLEVAPDFVDQEVLKVFTEKSMAWIRQASAKEKPFFLYLPYTSPHKPVIPMDEFKGKSQCGAYGDFMIETDHRIGQILKTLDDLKIAEDTMVIFSSDNGAERTWEARIKAHDHRSNGIYRDGKRSRYEGGHRVPFLIRWPAGIKAGSTCHNAVCQTDILATFAEMLGAKLPADAGEDSASFYPALTGKNIERGAIIHHASNGQFAIREGDWKLIVNTGNTGRRGKKPQGTPAPPKVNYELYNLKDDPSETKNLQAKHPEKIRHLEALLKKIKTGPRSTPVE